MSKSGQDDGDAAEIYVGIGKTLRLEGRSKAIAQSRKALTVYSEKDITKH